MTDSGDRRVKFEGPWGEAIESTEKCAELLRGVLWLEWNQFKDTSIPSWLPLDTIIVLEFIRPQCLKTLWEEAPPPLQLRQLRIVHALRLQSLPRSIGRLQHLKILSLEDGSSLSSLPEEFCELQLLEHLVLRGCRSLSSLPNRFGDLVSLRHLDLCSCTSLKRFPKSFKQLIQLKYLDLDGCVSLESLNNIANLKAVYFSDDKITYPTSSVGQLSLCFSSWYMGRILPIICQLSELKELKIYRCWAENSLEAINSLSIEISHMPGLQNLTIEGCESLRQIEISHIFGRQNLTIAGCVSLRQMEISHMSGLQNLTIEGCESLRQIEISHMFGRQNLTIAGCENLRM